MDNRTNILSMLGLALRGNRLAVGEEPVEAVARARDARVLLLASDAADNTKRRCRHFAEAGQCLWLTIPYTKDELGQAVGRSSVAIAALTDVGMAASFVHKLAALDPKKYSEAAERLDVKAKRAAERKAEMLAHEKNVRQGKFKKKAPAEETSPVQEEAASVQEAPQQRKPRSYRDSSRPYDGGKKPYGERKSDSGSRSYGEKKPYSGKKPFSGDRRTGDWKPRTEGGDKRPYGEKKPYGDRKPYGEKSGDFRKSDRPYGEKKPYTGKSRPSKANRPKSRATYNPYAHSLPVKKGKGSFRKRED